MRNGHTSARGALAAVLLASVAAATSASAATVTANFSGPVDDKSDFNNVVVGSDTMEVQIVGRDDANEVSLPPSPLGIGTATAAAAYELTTLSLDVDAIGLSFSAIDPVLFIYDNGLFGLDAFDIIAAFGTFEGDTPGSEGGSITYYATFDPGTFNDVALSTAVAQGLANTTAIVEEAFISFDPNAIAVNGCTSPNCFVRGALSLDPPLIIVEDPDPDPDPGSGSGGDPTPGVAPVPLPAAGWALLAALFGLAGLRRTARA
ncbi:MAG: hypothetical protein AAF689_16395 [Pseudomonadota bacterium]